MRILVIDDEVPTLKMFGLLLEALGHAPVTAESGEEGLISFDRERPDVVLTDIKMPGIDGMDVLRALKEADPRIEVIVITGHGDTELAIEALHLDATDFINKPVRREALEHALSRAEERIRLKRAKEEEIRLVAGPGVDAGPDAIKDAAQDGAAVVRIRGTVNSPAEPVLRHVFEEALLTGAPTCATPAPWGARCASPGYPPTCPPCSTWWALPTTPRWRRPAPSNKRQRAGHGARPAPLWTCPLPGAR